LTKRRSWTWWKTKKEKENWGNFSQITLGPGRGKKENIVHIG